MMRAFDSTIYSQDITKLLKALFPQTAATQPLSPWTISALDVFITYGIG